MNGLPRDVSRLVAGEIGNGGTDLVALAHARHRDAAVDRRLLIVGKGIGHRRTNEAGGDTVHGDVPARQFLREALAHTRQTGFCGDVVHLPRIAGVAHDAGDGDDSPALRLHHRTGAGAHQAETGFEIDADYLVPFLVLHAHRKVIARDPGVVDEDVHAAERIERGGNQFLDLLRIGQVARNLDVIAAGFGI